MPDPFVPVPNTALVEIRYVLNLQHVENTLWFEHGTDPSEAELATLAEDVYNWWHDQLATVQSTDVKFSEVVATSQTSESSPIASFNPGSATSGDVAVEAMPGNVSLAVSFRTGSRGRSFRGRNFAVGIPRTPVTGDQVSDAYAASIAAAYAEMIGADAVSSGWTWVVASRRHNKAPRETGVTTPVTAVLTVDRTVDSQRRRLTGRGN